MKAIHCYENKNKRYVTAAGKAMEKMGLRRADERRQPTDSSQWVTKSGWRVIGQGIKDPCPWIYDAPFFK